MWVFHLVTRVLERGKSYSERLQSREKGESVKSRGSLFISKFQAIPSPAGAPGQGNKPVLRLLLMENADLIKIICMLLIKMCGIYELDSCLLLASCSV